MTNRVRARLRQDKFEPLEPIDLPDNKEAVLSISASRRRVGDGIHRSAGKSSGLDAEAFIRDLYPARQAQRRDGPSA